MPLPPRDPGLGSQSVFVVDMCPQWTQYLYYSHYYTKYVDTKRPYCFLFICYNKPFYFVITQSLWHNLIKQVVGRKMLVVLRYLHGNVKSCLRYSNVISEFLICKSGLLQGEVLTPILFSCMLMMLSST